MPELSLTFINAGDNAELDAEVNDSLTCEQLIQALINEHFIPPLNDDTRAYTLAIKGAGLIAEGQTLAEANVRTGDHIRVSVTQRGGGNSSSRQENINKSQHIQWSEAKDVAADINLIGLFAVKRIYREHLTLQDIYKEDVRNCVIKFIKEASRYKFIHAILQLIIFIGAAIVSVTIAITQIPHWFPAIISGIVAIATAIVNYYKLNERSTNLYLTAESIQHEYNRFIMGRSTYKDLEARDALNIFMDRVENIMHNHTKRSIALEELKDVHDKNTG